MSYPTIPWPTFADLKQMLHGFWASKPTYTESQYPDLQDKVVIVTGGNTGLGYETVKSLAGSTKARIYVFSRNKEKTLAAIKQIQLEIAEEYNVSNSDIRFIQVDLSDLTTIKPAVEEFLKQEQRIDIIIHNAGIMGPPVGSKSKQGYELQWGTNVVGPHLLQRLLDPLFIKTSETNPPGFSRIVWVSSTAHLFAPQGGVFWDNVNYENLKLSQTQVRTTLYAQSKAGNLIQARTWSRKHNYPNVISSSLCPGYLYTDLIRNLNSFEQYFVKRLIYPRRYGAYTELYAAFSPDVKDGAHTIGFGVPSHARTDLTSEAVGDKTWAYLDKETDAYL